MFKECFSVERQAVGNKQKQLQKTQTDNNEVAVECVVFVYMMVLWPVCSFGFSAIHEEASFIFCF